ncbi:MAG: hypothetical protein JW384_03636 [Nitrosomonadaceae bacterium]|nr:hypothetical protein [Nitrosomonadaceae bacterium]
MSSTDLAVRLRSHDSSWPQHESLLGVVPYLAVVADLNRDVVDNDRVHTPLPATGSVQTLANRAQISSRCRSSASLGVER